MFIMGSLSNVHYLPKYFCKHKTRKGRRLLGMQKSNEVKKVLSSWKKCIEKGGMIRYSNPVYLDDSILDSILGTNKICISIFERSLRVIKESMTNVIFLLTDENGVLLKKVGLSEVWLRPGLSFAEKDCGVNAISMCLCLNEPVYMLPDYHYCQLFRNWNCYATPILRSKKNCVAVVSINKSLPKTAIAIVDLLKYKIENELSDYSHKEDGNIDDYMIKNKISNRQKVILRYMAQARTDTNIAIELGLSQNTIKYHKKELFKKLGVGTSIEAVVKALKLNIITLDEI